MNITFTSNKQLFDTLGLLAIVTTTISVINPYDFYFFHALTANAISVIFIFLAIGFGAFIFRNNLLLLTSFSACISLSMYLKNAQNTNFAYAQPTQKSQINIASFVLNNAQSIIAFSENFSTLNTDLISIQVPVKLIKSDWIIQKTKKEFPFYKKTICGDSLAVLIFSTSKIYDLDTLCFDNAITIAGAIKIKGIEEKVAFISTHVPNQIIQTQKQLALLSQYIQTNYNDKPFLAMSGTEIKSWMPEIQKFKTRNSLKDSSIEIDLYNINKHIFYSDNLVCTHFSSTDNGNGVIASYQLKNTSIVAL